MDEAEHVDIYPVGLLHDLKVFYNQLCVKYTGKKLRYLKPTRTLLKNIRRGVFERLVERNFRAVRMYFNGYLAESSTTWFLVAGHGWTKNRALKSLYRIKKKSEGSLA